MLTREYEGTRLKCSHYYPEDRGEVLAAGPITVTNEGKEELPPDGATIERRLVLRWNGPPEGQGGAGEGGSWVVRHLHYVEWPDHGVPRKTAAVRELIRGLREGEGRHDSRGGRGGSGRPGDNAAGPVGPVVVHCR